MGARPVHKWDIDPSRPRTSIWVGVPGTRFTASTPNPVTMVLNHRSNERTVSTSSCTCSSCFPPHSAIMKCVSKRLSKISRLTCVSATKKRKVPMFKKNYDHLPKDTYLGLYKEATRANPNYFLTSGNGKSSAKVYEYLHPNGAHR